MFSVKKKSENIQRNEKIWPFQRKRKNSRKFVPEKDLTEDTLDKDLRIIVLKMFKELKENVEKVKKTMYEQNKNINKEKT